MEKQMDTKRWGGKTKSKKDGKSNATWGVVERLTCLEVVA